MGNNAFGTGNGRKPWLSHSKESQCKQHQDDGNKKGPTKYWFMDMQCVYISTTLCTEILKWDDFLCRFSSKDYTEKILALYFYFQIMTSIFLIYFRRYRYLENSLTILCIFFTIFMLSSFSDYLHFWWMKNCNIKSEF